MDRLIGPRRPGGFRPPPPPLRQRRAFSVIRGPVESAGAPEEARALAALFSVDQKLERALTHGFHSYAGRLHPFIARGAIGRFSPPGATVLDPFCGSGTVLVEALVAGRGGIGIDASPLATMLARVRTRRMPEGWRRDLTRRAQDIASEVGRPPAPASARHCPAGQVRSSDATTRTSPWSCSACARA